MAKIILIEGPDKCGKTTFIAKKVKEGHLSAALPSREFKAKLIAEPERYNNFEGFMTDTREFWHNTAEKMMHAAAAKGVDIYLDRDILSMMAYQGVLNKQVDLDRIIGVYKKLLYVNLRPSKIIYLTNKPFADYDENDPIERQGYEAIRDAYEKIINHKGLLELGIKIEFMELTYDNLY